MLPTTVLVNILGCLRRRDLDVLELVDRAFGAVIAAHENHLPRRSLSLIFFNEGGVSLVSFKDTMKHVLVVELPQYLTHTVITKVHFKLLRGSTLTEEMYQELRPCRAHFAADAMCEFRSLYVFPPDVLRRAFMEVFMCNTLVFALPDSCKRSLELRRYVGEHEQDLGTLPCIANCANLQIAHYDEAFFDANGALEWLLGTHSVTTSAKHLSIEEIDIVYWDDFVSALIAAIEHQFVQATSQGVFLPEAALVRLAGT